MWVKGEVVKPFFQVFYGHVHKVRNAHAVDFHVFSLLAEPSSVACRAYRFPAVSAEHHAVLNLVLVLLKHSEEFVDAYTVVFVSLAVGGQTMP